MHTGDIEALCVLVHAGLDCSWVHEYRHGGRGSLMKSFGEEYLVVKMGREYHGCGEEYNVEKRKGDFKTSRKLKVIEL